MRPPPNQAAPVNAPIAPWFHLRHRWRRVTEQRRWATATIRTTVSNPKHMKPTNPLRRIIQQGASIALLAAASVHAQNPIAVDSLRLFTFTGIQAFPGQVFQFQAAGSVDLASFDGPYITDPNGTILVAPPVGSGAYDFFTSNTDPRGVPPA